MISVVGSKNDNRSLITFNLFLLTTIVLPVFLCLFGDESIQFTLLNIRNAASKVMHNIVLSRGTICGPGSSVGIATDYRLDGLWIESR